MSFWNNGGMLTLNLSNGMTQYFMVLGCKFFFALGKDTSNVGSSAMIAQYFTALSS